MMLRSESKLIRYGIVYEWKTDETLEMTPEINDDERRMVLLGGIIEPAFTLP